MNKLYTRLSQQVNVNVSLVCIVCTINNQHYISIIIKLPRLYQNISQFNQFRVLLIKPIYKYPSCRHHILEKCFKTRSPAFKQSQ